MMSPRRAPLSEHEAALWGAYVADAITRAPQARPSRWRTPGRLWAAGWRHRAQLVPVLVIAALWCAAAVVRAGHLSPWGVAVAGAVALAVQWWRAGIARPAAMLRPAAAVAYLIATAVQAH